MARLTVPDNGTPSRRLGLPFGFSPPPYSTPIEVACLSHGLHSRYFAFSASSFLTVLSLCLSQLAVL